MHPRFAIHLCGLSPSVCRKSQITTTVINWVKQTGELLPDAYDPEETPQVGELDELQTFVGSKKTKSGYGPS